MEALLKNDFLRHHHIPFSEIEIVSVKTTASYFELNDRANNIIYFNKDEGFAAFENQNQYEILVINYEKYINLFRAFQQGRERCDFILFTFLNNEYFILSELTDTKPQYVTDFISSGVMKEGKGRKAKSQLLKSLIDLTAVPAINSFVDSFSNKRCCFFSKQAEVPVNAPDPLTATESFNSLNTLLAEGVQMPNQEIESIGFTYWEYFGQKVFSL